MTKSALDSQHGGDHYKKLGAYQPWEVLAKWLTPEELRGYMKGTAISYIAREAEKGGDLDIDKAIHTMQIYRELATTEQTESQLITVLVREEAARKAGHRSSLYVKFDKDFLPDALVADVEYLVTMVSEISFVVLTNKKPMSVYFKNTRLRFSGEVRETLDSHLRYYS